MIHVDRAAYDGFIFDCDGTLADTMPLHYLAWSDTLDARLGEKSKFSEELFYRFGGRPAREIVAVLDEMFGYRLDPEATAHAKEMRFLELLPGIGPVREVMEVLDRLEPGAKVAVASGGLTAIVAKTLDFLGLKVGPGEKIQVLVCAEDVKRGKPAPDMFLLAAERMGTAPARTLVFEDAVPGIDAAKAAGMKYAVVPRPAKC